jgi:hypothetical protein
MYIKELGISGAGLKWNVGFCFWDEGRLNMSAHFNLTHILSLIPLPTLFTRFSKKIKMATGIVTLSLYLSNRPSNIPIFSENEGFSKKHVGFHASFLTASSLRLGCRQCRIPNVRMQPAKRKSDAKGCRSGACARSMMQCGAGVQCESKSLRV